MTTPREPLFLEKRSYRRRRLHDAARLVPVLGAGLFLLPVLWTGGDEVPSTMRGIVYLFAAWSVLIVIAGLLAPRLNADRDDRFREDG